MICRYELMARKPRDNLEALIQGSIVGFLYKGFIKQGFIRVTTKGYYGGFLFMLFMRFA